MADYQFYLVVPADLSIILDQRMAVETANLFAGVPSPDSTLPELPLLTVCFDPAVRSSYRSAVSGAVHRAAATMESAYSFQHMNKALNQRLGAMGAGGSTLTLESALQQRVAIEQITAGPDPFAALPTAVQQNVPAWALFGMFFIVVPLSTGILERRSLR